MSAAPSPHVVLLDLDGTLLLSGGAGRAAINVAFSRLFDVDDAFEGLEPHGKTDPAIFREILRRRRIPVADEDAAVAAVRREYEREFRVTFAVARPRLMPGAAAAVEALGTRDDVLLGVLTGNLETTARLKLERFGLDRHIRFGAFSSDNEHRPALVRVAMARASELLDATVDAGPGVVVVGDTPLDVECALQNDVRAVGVGAHHFGEGALLRAGAHATLPDLTDLPRLMAAIGLRNRPGAAARC